MGRVTTKVRAAWPDGNAGRVLAVLLVLGIVLRVLAMASLWPVSIVLEDRYQDYAGSNPFMDPLHPAGYSLLLGALGAVTHRVYVTVVLQHLAGIGTALLLGAGTRRVTGSAWAGLLPAAVVLLVPDIVFLEQTIMSETASMFAMAVGLYAAARAFDEPSPWWRWPAIAGVALALGTVIRDAQLLMIPVVAAALLLSARRRWLAPTALAGAAVAVLLIYAIANAALGPRFGIAPSPGWYLYGRVAQFADCSKFKPPAGTEALCQNTALSQRRSSFFYMYEPQSPAVKLFGVVGRDDGLIYAWSKRALEAQPGDFLSTAWAYLRSYYLPDTRPQRLKSSSELDPELDFAFQGNAIIDAVQYKDLETYFDPFKPHHWQAGIDVLRRWQVIVRFTPVALWITTVLTLIGLVVGTRRSRAAVVLYGLGGIALIVAPALTSNYTGRYTVTMAGPMAAAAAVVVTELIRAGRRRRPLADDAN